MKMAAPVVLALLFLLALVTALHWPAGPRLFVQVMAVPGLLLVLAHLAQTFRKRAVTPPPGAGPSPDAPAQDRAESAQAIRTEATFWLWILGCLIITGALGTVAGAAVFMFLYLRWSAREGWLTSITATAGTLLFLWGVLGQVFHISLPEGLIRWFM